jgi:hypothetical protein
MYLLTKYFREESTRAITRAIIHDEDLRVPSIYDAPDNSLDARGFVIGADEKEIFIFWHRHEGQEREQVESSLHAGTLCAGEGGEKSKIKIQYLHTRVRQLLSRLRRVKRSDRALEGKIRIRGVRLLKR